MKIMVKHPQTGKMLEHHVQPATNDLEPGWSVLLPEGNSIFIVQQQQQWLVRNDETVDPDLVKAIGQAIDACQAGCK